MNNTKKTANEKWNSNNKEVMKKSTYKSKCFKYIADYVATQEELESVFKALEQKAILVNLSIPRTDPIPSNLPSKAFLNKKASTDITNSNRQTQRRERAYYRVTEFLEKNGKPTPSQKEELMKLTDLYIAETGSSKRTTTDLFNYYCKYLELKKLPIV